MPKARSVRSKRVAELIQREIARALQTEYATLIQQFVTVLEVVLSNDLSHARVFVSIMAEEGQIQACLSTLNTHAPEIRQHLATHLGLRTVPQLRFHYDPSIQQSNRIQTLLEEAKAKSTRTC